MPISDYVASMVAVDVAQQALIDARAALKKAGVADSEIEAHLASAVASAASAAAKAIEAATSADAARTSRLAAEDAATLAGDERIAAALSKALVDQALTDATAQAGIATTQAGIATTKAGEAAASVASAASESSAAASSAAEASVSAADALAAPASVFLKRVDTIATLKTIAPTTAYDVMLSGYYAAGDGGGGRFRGVTGASAGTYVDNGGTIILPTGGNGSAAWLREVGNTLPIEVFGGKADGVTDNLAAFNAFHEYANVVRINGGGRASLEFGVGSYYFSDTINILCAIELRGGGSGLVGSYAHSVILIENDRPGIIINRFDTNGIGGTVAAHAYGGADGTIIEGLRIRPKGNFNLQTPMKWYSWGVWMRTRAIIRKCLFSDWGHSGIHIRATASSSGDLRGNANGFRIEDCGFVTIVGNGLWVVGADANAGTTINLQFSTCGQTGLCEAGFLGNTHIAPQTSVCGGKAVYSTRYYKSAPIVSYNGNLYAIKPTDNDAADMTSAWQTRPSGDTSDNAVWYYVSAGAESSTVNIWGRFSLGGRIYDVQVGQEANMWTTAPEVGGNAVWTDSGVASGSIYYYDYALSKSMALGEGPHYQQYDGTPVVSGPYTLGGPYRGVGTSNRSYFINCYTEGSQFPDSYFAQHVQAAGAYKTPVSKFSKGANLYSEFGDLLNNVGGFRSQGLRTDGQTSKSTLGGDTPYGDIITYSGTTDFPSTFRLRHNGTDLIMDYGGLTAARFMTFTGINTTLKFGRSAGVPHHAMMNNFAIGIGSTARIVSYGSAAPTTGEHAQGEIVFSTTPAVSGYVGWSCVTTGTPGTWVPFGLVSSGYNEMTEMTAPAAPAANGARIYAEDNGAGKTRLMVKFATGAAQQIAIEP